MATLRDIVNAAISNADASLKVASARDIEIPAVESVVPAAAEPVESKVAATTSAEYALKIAEALETAAEIVAKLAESVPESLPAGSSPKLDAKPVTPKPAGEGPSTAPHLGKAVAVANVINHDGAKSIPENGPTGAIKGASWTADAEATARLVKAKTAQAETLRRLGQEKAAAALQEEISSLKVAADPSSPQAVISAGTYRALALDPAVPAGRAPDNAGAIAMTRAQARDASTREADAVLGHTAQKDPATAAAVDNSQGAKVSEKVADVREDAPSYLPELLPFGSTYVGARRAAEGKKLEGAARGFLGGTVGGIVGGLPGSIAMMSHNPTVQAAGLGAKLVGSVVGGAHGTHLATRGMIAEGDAQRRASARAAVGLPPEGEVASEGAKLAALRNILELAGDPHAAPEDRARAQKIAAMIQQNGA